MQKSDHSGGRPPEKAEYREGPDAARAFDEAMTRIVSVSKAVVDDQQGKPRPKR